MVSKIKKYIPFIQTGIKISLSYKWDFLFYRFGDMLEAFVTYFLWLSIFKSSKSQDLHGFSMNEMALYIFVSFFINILAKTGINEEIGNKVRDGSIAISLLRPISFVNTYMFTEIGIKILQMSMLFFPIIGLLILEIMTKHIHIKLICAFIFCISFTFSYFINFYFNVCFGFIAFFSKNIWGSTILKQAIVSIASGSLIPLNFFPIGLKNILNVLPFSSLVYTPTMIFLGKYSMSYMLLSLCVQLIWIFIFLIISKIIWKVALTRLTIQGG